MALTAASTILYIGYGPRVLQQMVCSCALYRNSEREFFYTALHTHNCHSPFNQEVVHTQNPQSFTMGRPSPWPVTTHSIVTATDSKLPSLPSASAPGLVQLTP